MRDEDPYLFFQGGMATQKLSPSRLQDLHARVLIDGVPIVRTFGSGLLLEPNLALVERVFNGRLSVCRVSHFQPFADLVLLPDVVVVVEHVGGTVQRGR